MHQSQIRILSNILGAASLLLLACGDDAPATGGGTEADAGEDLGTADGAGQDLGCAATLAFLADETVVLGAEESIDLTVVYEDCGGSGIADAIVAFELIGETGGSRLLAQTAITNAGGEASVGLTAGDSDAEFELRVSADGVASVSVDVTVTTSSLGSIDVQLSYAGEISFSRFIAALYGNVACSDINPFDLPTAFQSAAPVTRLAEEPSFEGIPAAEDYTVVVVAERESLVLGFGCTEGVDVARGRRTDVAVDIEDLPIVFDGVYELDNHFDLSGALPPSVETTLQVLDEMTDDDDIRGNSATEDYGIDPAAFLLDFVYRQFCCWEAVDGHDFGECQDQDVTHPFGDLEQLYTENFTSWDGAQPSARFLCGALESANELAQTMVQGLITDNVPDIVLRLIAIAGDLSRAFTQMHITSELTLGALSRRKDGEFSHELLTMIVELHNLDGDLNTFEFDLADAGLVNLQYSAETTVSDDDQLTIPEHSFQLDFGILLNYIYRQVLLPSLECDDGDGDVEPCRNTGDLFKTWIDCSEVGEYLATEIGFLGAGSYEGFCATGLTLAGTYIDGEIAGAVDSVSIITIAGVCLAGDIDDRRIATTLVDGVWEGSLEEDENAVGDFDGTFDGERQEDE